MNCLQADYMYATLTVATYQVKLIQKSCICLADKDDLLFCLHVCQTHKCLKSTKQPYMKQSLLNV